MKNCNPQIVSGRKAYDVRRNLAAFLSIILCLVLAGCSFAPAPEKDLGKMLHYLADGKIAKAERFVYEEALNINTDNKHAKKFYTAMFSSISYVISGSAISDDYAEVSVSVTMIDMESLVAKTSLETLENTFSGSDANVKYYNLIVEKINQNDVSYDTNSVTVCMYKVDGKWKVSMAQSSAFADAIAGGVGELLGY